MVEGFAWGNGQVFTCYPLGHESNLENNLSVQTGERLQTSGPSPNPTYSVSLVYWLHPFFFPTVAYRAIFVNFLMGNNRRMILLWKVLGAI